MGCGIKFKANEGEERPQPDQAVQVFFTRNGQEVNNLSRRMTKPSKSYKPHHGKTCFCHMRTTKAQISLRIYGGLHKEALVPWLSISIQLAYEQTV